MSVFLTWEQSVGAGQAALVRSVPPAQSPAFTTALLHQYQRGVVHTRELLTAPCGEALASNTHALEFKIKIVLTLFCSFQCSKNEYILK